MNRRSFLKNLAFGGTAIAFTNSITGCKSIPSVDQIFITSELIGRSTGKVILLTDFTDDQREILLDVLNKIALVTPDVDETFEVTWVKAASEYLATIELDDSVKLLIISAVNVIGKGVDYIFTKRYPDAKQYKDLVEAAIHGFIDGITTVIVPPNNLSASYLKTFDRDAYNYLKQFEIKK